MNKKIEDMIRLAKELDSVGMYKEADEVTEEMERLDYSPGEAPPGSLDNKLYQDYQKQSATQEAARIKGLKESYLANAIRAHKNGQNGWQVLMNSMNVSGLSPQDKKDIQMQFAQQTGGVTNPTKPTDLGQSPILPGQMPKQPTQTKTALEQGVLQAAKAASKRGESGWDVVNLPCLKAGASN